MALLIDRVELGDKCENGFQRVILWHESGSAMVVLKAESFNEGMDGAGREAVMCELLGVMEDGLHIENSTE